MNSFSDPVSCCIRLPVRSRVRSTTCLCLTAAQMDARNWPASARPHLTEPHGTFWYFSLVNPDDTTIYATLLNVTERQCRMEGGCMLMMWQLQDESATCWQLPANHGHQHGICKHTQTLFFPKWLFIFLWFSRLGERQLSSPEQYRWTWRGYNIVFIS